MKLVILAVSFVMLTSFGTLEEVSLNKTSNSEVVIGESFSLINDSKDEISIHTGTGFVSLNKGSKTSIGCNVGKEVRWANEGKKGDVIFKITADMCGKTLKLSELTKKDISNYNLKPKALLFSVFCFYSNILFICSTN